MMRKRGEDFGVGGRREEGGSDGMSELAPSLEGRTRLVRILDDSPKRPALTTLSAPTGDGILALYRECAGGGPEGSMGMNKVERATPSGPRRWRRL